MPLQKVNEWRFKKRFFLRVIVGIIYDNSWCRGLEWHPALMVIHVGEAPLQPELNTFLYTLMEISDIFLWV